MTELRFTVPGVPRGWARARKGRGRAHFFTDQKTASFERRVALYACEVMHAAGLPMLNRAVWLHVDAYWPAKKRAKHTHRVYKTTKEDWDNVGKGISDALNEVVWVDDARVVDARVCKWYAPPDEEPRTEITIRSLDGEWT